MPSYDQDIIQDLSPVDCTILHAGNFDKLLSHLQRQKDEFWSISATFDDNGHVQSFGLATTDKVHVIHGAKSLPQDKLARLWTIDPSILLVGFNMDTLALGLYRTFNTRIAVADLGLAYGKPQGEYNPSALIKQLYPDGVKSITLQTMWNNKKTINERDLCLQAWISFRIAQRRPETVKKTLKINTLKLTDRELSLLCNLYLQHRLADNLIPDVTCAEFSECESKGGVFVLKNARFKTRIRPNPEGHLVFQDSTGKTITGRTRKTDGKTTYGYINGRLDGIPKSVQVVGKEMPSYAQYDQRTVALNVLLGKTSLRQSYYTGLLWQLRNEPLSAPTPLKPMLKNNKLNDSQNLAVASMLDTTQITLVHGPPGTGKTTVIASAAKVWAQRQQPLYITAHSNVAVKNIAEKLLKENIDFKLIVSKEFHKEWHEDMYHQLEEHLVRSDMLPSQILPLSRLLGSTKIILCTLSMLSNPLFKQNGMFTCVPIVKLIVDEASQINIFEYLSIFTRFHKTLKKVCFFGDPNQLPPFGQEQISSVKSIFDLNHLSKAALFLNEQYRMPIPIGHFISREVYQDRLFSHHSIASKSCVALVDVSGSEMSKRGSYVNLKEIQSILHLVKNYYRDKDYCVITPYDAQRSAIIETFKKDNIPSERVFNVDSFQGNEADYVLISVVRTKHTGFLTSVNRINVMLTRCRRAMVIVANRKFIDGIAKDTLLGRLARHWSEKYAAASCWTNWTEIAGGRAILFDCSVSHSK